MRSFKNVGIIGAGSMGIGIAQIASTSDCNVFIFDQNKSASEQAVKKLEKVLIRLIEKGKISPIKKDSILSNIKIVESLESMKDSDLIIEAIVENSAVKKEIFCQIESTVSDDCVLATNTSSISITSLASCLKNPIRFIGIHFFNPAPIMPLVEIIPALQTNNNLVKEIHQLLLNWNKKPVVAKDTPGFIVNRIARPFYSEALRIYEEQIADFATIDFAMKHIGGFRMGPFELMDFIGNDVNYAVTESVFKAFYYDPRYKPSFTQKQYADAGWHGRKSSKGYYDYGDNIELVLPSKDDKLLVEIFERVLVMLINEAMDALYLGIASEQDIELAMTKGVNYPKGLINWGKEKSFSWVVSKIDTLYGIYHEDRYRCSPLLRKKASL
ncbi:3-hydroxyacyl-CoA dehydrogenase NAD-binding domain-containing protein [Flavobacteriales bacterium]|nr:3-hydroxyacyl-CoA dehydrogenase NAD-binding domain-containing protein [Flavobacteriales bacterium]